VWESVDVTVPKVQKRLMAPADGPMELGPAQGFEPVRSLVLLTGAAAQKLIYYYKWLRVAVFFLSS